MFFSFRYFAFITKHPKLYRFACHVFLGEKSTRPVNDALGWVYERYVDLTLEILYNLSYRLALHLSQMFLLASPTTF
jgi:hypothetical protein